MLLEKRCYRCKTVKSAQEFFLDRKHYTGLQSQCKSCRREYQREQYANRREQICDERRTEYQRPEVKAAHKLYRAKNTDKRQALWRGWYAKPENRKRCIERASLLARNNRDEINLAKRERYNREPQEKLRRNLSTLLGQVFRRKKMGVRSESVMKHLGCTVAELALHLQSQFKTGMSWENHSKYGWHVDHIRPLASFDLSDPAQRILACHYTNLQPLWAGENLSKGSRMDIR